MKTRAEFYGYKLAENVDGHRLSDFPHHYYTKKQLAELNVSPKSSFWVLEIQIMDQDMRFGAFYEDL